jgi:16S rRNA (uracil1498-N3)-methyltransferase
MRQFPRLYIDADLEAPRLPIPDSEAHYLSHVLRLRPGERIVVFNGRGAERVGTIESLTRRRAQLHLGEHLTPRPEPAIEVHLVQALLKSDAMDLVVQKATELGVHTVHAVKTDYSVIKLDRARVPRRIEHWGRIARSACEQSGRHRPPRIVAHDSLAACVAALPEAGARLAFHTGAAPDHASAAPAANVLALLIGPEGGLSATDLDLVDRAGFERRSLGSFVLRAETAAITACALARLCREND